MLRLANLFEKEAVQIDEAVQMCEYMAWADLHNIELTVEYVQEDLDNCWGLEGEILSYYNSVDEKLSYLASTEFLTYLRDHLTSVTGLSTYESTLHYKKHFKDHFLSQKPERLTATNANTQPYYVFLMSESANLHMIVSALTPSSKGVYEHINFATVPSSTLIFEVVQQADNSSSIVNALFND